MTRKFCLQLLRRNVGVFTEYGGAIGYLSTPEGILVVDAQFPEQAGHFIAEIRKQSDRPFKWLINTHHHHDHTAGNSCFQGLVEHVVAHRDSLFHQHRVAEEENSVGEQLFPDIIFAECWETRLGDERIRAHHFGPAHTAGDCVVHFEHANVAHIGDLVFNRKYPFILKKDGADIQNWIAALDRVLETFDNETIFICGHAADRSSITPTKAAIRVFQDFLGKLLESVEKALRSGKPKAEIPAMRAIPGVRRFQGDRLKQNLEAALEEVLSRRH